MTVLVVGALHWDVVVRAPRLPQLDETLPGSSVAYQFGGKGGNQAVAAALAGANVAFAGRIGSDQAGAAMQHRLSKAGVDVSGLQVGRGASGMSAAIVDEDGNYGAVIVSAENHEFEVGLMSFPKGCRMVLIQNEMTHNVFRMVKQKALEADIPLVLNAAPAQGLAGADLEHIDVLIVNRLEAAHLLGRDPSDMDPAESVRDLQSLAPGSDIIITLGGDGVMFARKGQAPQHQPAKKTVVRSTHGAGDVFVGTFAALSVQDIPLAAAIERAQQAAADQVSGNR